MSPVEKRGKESPYWRSLRELADSPEYREALEREFPEGAVDRPGAFSRRGFLQLLGASVALAGFSGCRWPEDKIVPYARRPAGRAPGKPVSFATALERRCAKRGLLVTSYDGRPVKVEGNPGDPVSRGGTDVFDQASILDLYDPDRSKGLLRREGSQRLTPGWKEFLDWSREHFAGLRRRRGAGLAVLCEPTGSECVAALRARLADHFPEARWFEYDPLSRDAEREGAAIAFGAPYRMHWNLLGNVAVDGAVAAIGADLFGDHPAALGMTRDFARARRSNQGPTNRLYVVESAPTITGGMADHRLPVRPSEMGLFALALAAELAARHDITAPEEARAALRPFAGHPFPKEFLAAIAEDLASHRGRSPVAAGHHLPAEAHAAIHLINELLGNNNGNTVTATAGRDRERPAHIDAIRSLAGMIRAGEVKTLLILGGNPAYDAPADLDFASLLAEVDTTIHLSESRNETSTICGWHLPEAHAFESWDLGRAYDGTVLATQPLIDPLYGGKTAAEVLAWIVEGRMVKSHDIAKETARRWAPAGADFPSFWNDLLRTGVLSKSAWPRERPNLRIGETVRAIGRLAAAERGTGAGPELLFVCDRSMEDGRHANNAWLQELPDPITKLTWDNAALLSPATAKRLGVETEEMIRIRRAGREMEIAACVLPGMAPDTIALPLGYGRVAAGRVGEGVGFDTYRLRTSDAFYEAGAAEAAKTGRKHPLALTQDHHHIDTKGMDEREKRTRVLVRQADVEEFRKDPKRAVHGESHHPPLVSLWKEHSYEGHSWGMAIDLSVCTGCNACVIACQAENNIPVVGKEQVRNQREMHWIRVDRYYRGEPENPEMVHQPVACVHCENAPCEQVCPVAATVHSSEGLNTMVYNRCIGTRYCSNNCPYKVRRFNFFNYHKKLEPTEKMAFNPEVTVRSRGVMEKCTYCVQRIEAVKIEAKNEKRPIRDGEITPACAQACPAEAIVFGDLSDPKSRVARLHAQARAYTMLAELNVKPHTAYLARIGNKNRRLKGPEGNGEHHG